jgi:hypothetical protein
VKNDYGTEEEARALNGLEEPLKRKTNETAIVTVFKPVAMKLLVNTLQAVKYLVCAVVIRKTWKLAVVL